MFHFSDGTRAVEAAAQATAALEPTAEVVEAARMLAAMLHGALRGEPLAAVVSPRSGEFGARSLPRELATWLESDPTRVRESFGAPALDALSTARRVLATSAGFGAGALRIANLGGDSDVIGAIHGQLAGAFYGQASLPVAWLRALARADHIEALAGQLLDAGTPGEPGRKTASSGRTAAL
jgi:ADP-ribosyl-[dinitrogen reductase] hydrolase